MLQDSIRVLDLFGFIKQVCHKKLFETNMPLFRIVCFHDTTYIACIQVTLAF